MLNVKIALFTVGVFIVLFLIALFTPVTTNNTDCDNKTPIHTTN